MSDTTFKKTRRLKDSVNDTEIIGKIQPQAVDMEEAVLGALMLDRNAIHQVIELLKPDTFYHEAHKLIFEAIKNLVDRTQPVDILTVTAELRQMGKLDAVGGAYYITRLTNRVSSAAHIEYHSHIVVQKYLQRELIRVSGDILKNAYEDTADVFELLDSAEQKLYNIKDENIKRNYTGISDLLAKAIKQIESLKEHEGGLTGVPSGLKTLDNITAGWQKSDLIIIAARPGMGKTAFVLTVARNAAINSKVPVAIFSLEMSSVQLVTRLIAAETELSAEKLKKGSLMDFEWQQLNTKVRTLSEAPIYIDDTPALSIFDLKAKCRRLKSHHDIGLVVVDYLQLMRADDKTAGNREQEISYISRSLKGLAKELDVPVIALAQLSREVEKTTDKRPLLSHLRESGSIEQDADMVGFIYRPEYYKITEDAEGNDLTGVAEIIIAKHRNGPVDTAQVKFVGQFAKFINLDHGGFSMEDYDPKVTMVTMSSRINEAPDANEEEGVPF